jgi:hypothetical protein
MTCVYSSTAVEKFLSVLPRCLWIYTLKPFLFVPMSCPHTFRIKGCRKARLSPQLTCRQFETLTAVLLHPRLRNEAISQHRAAGKKTGHMADSPLMDACFAGFLSSKIGPSFLLLAFPLLSFTARFSSGTLSLPTLLHIFASPRPPSRATCSGRRSRMVLIRRDTCGGFLRERGNVPHYFNLM